MTFIETIWNGMTEGNFSFAIFVVAVLQFIGVIVQIILTIAMMRSRCRRKKTYTARGKKIRFARELKKKKSVN